MKRYDLIQIGVDYYPEHYSEHPAVIGWQTDNEFGMLDCHCDACNIAFRT